MMRRAIHRLSWAITAALFALTVAVLLWWGYAALFSSLLGGDSPSFYPGQPRLSAHWKDGPIIIATPQRQGIHLRVEDFGQPLVRPFRWFTFSQQDIPGWIHEDARIVFEQRQWRMQYDPSSIRSTGRAIQLFGHLYVLASDRQWIFLPYPLIAMVLGALPTVLLVRRAASQRRQKIRSSLGLCMRCGYDLRSSPDRCPECGMVSLALNGERL